MAKSPAPNASLTLKIELEKPAQGELHAYAFDRNGRMIARAPVRDGATTLPLSERQARESRVFLAPDNADKQPTLRDMQRAHGYEIVLADGLRGRLTDRVRVPGRIVDLWPFCFCPVRGRVVRPVGPAGHTQDRPVCGARVHICEVDRWPRIIAQLPDRDILRLRDDLLHAVLRKIPVPPHPGPDPGPIARVRSPLRFPGVETAIHPQPQPNLAALARKSADRVALNPQPLPPGIALQLQGTPLAGLTASSVNQVRSALILNIDSLKYYLCLWPWWWWRFRCDELAVVETDAFGRFEKLLIFRCDGDHPDLYFWVEYPIGGSWETVYRPPIACWTHWNYVCGSEVTLRVDDPRVPACGGDPDLPGLSVAVMSIGRGVSLSEIQNNGLSDDGAPFGGKIEPRVWMSRGNLIAAGVTHYRWSYRRLTGPDGAAPAVGAWTIVTRDVTRHYSVLGPGGLPAFPSDPMGPDGDNKFRIQPPDPPAPGLDWETLDEREDLASAHFETTLLPSGLPAGASDAEKAAATAGQYELKLELLRADNSVVDWTAAGIALAIADEAAPFGADEVDTVAAPAFNRLMSGAHLVGFRMILRVDNNRCDADIRPVSGAGLGVDAECGFIEYQPGAVATVSFLARHPWGFATFDYTTTRGTATAVPQADTGGIVGAASAASTDGNFSEGPDFVYSKPVPVNTLLTVNPGLGGGCANAAFAEVLNVWGTATDGYGSLGYNAHDAAAYALAVPCDCHGNGNGHDH